MFTEEAIWIENVLQPIQPVNGNNHIANLGSSTLSFRTQVQPHIQQHILAPLEHRGWKIYHMDYKMDEGVDVVSDITDRTLGASFKNHFALTICTNMLEHVEYIDMAAANLLSVTAPNGYMLITVPYKYKIHHDPIDNGFRPTPAQIMALFPAGAVQQIASSIISISDKKYYRVKQSSIPFWGYRDRILYYLGKRHKVSGILLKVIK